MPSIVKDYRRGMALDKVADKYSITIHSVIKIVHAYYKLNLTLSRR